MPVTFKVTAYVMPTRIPHLICLITDPNYISSDFIVAFLLHSTLNPKTNFLLVQYLCIPHR